MTYAIKFKCSSCGLHYQLFTWNADWTEQYKSFCPECGVKGGKMVWGPEETDKQIFEFVPGATQLTALS